MIRYYSVTSVPLYVTDTGSSVGPDVTRLSGARTYVVCMPFQTNQTPRWYASGHPRSPASHKTVSRPRIKSVASSAGGPESSGRLMAEMSSVQALMDLALPRFVMA